MWDLGTIQVVNIAATMCRREGRPERNSRCGTERRFIVEKLEDVAKGYFHGMPAKAIDHYSKKDN